MPREAPRETDSGGAPSPLGCSAPRVSQNGPRAKASPFGEFSLGMFCAARVTGRPGGESPVIRRFSLGLFRGVGRLPWQASRHLRDAAAAGGPEGDGIEAENVSLGPFRGEKRRPWEVPWRLDGEHVAKGREGDGTGPESVTLGPRRGKRRRPWLVPWHLGGAHAPLACSTPAGSISLACQSSK